MQRLSERNYISFSFCCQVHIEPRILFNGVIIITAWMVKSTHHSSNKPKNSFAACSGSKSLGVSGQVTRITPIKIWVS